MFKKKRTRGNHFYVAPHRRKGKHTLHYSL